MNLAGPQRQLSYFFFGQAFADGLRTTVAVLLPGLLGYQLGHFDAGLTASVGALCLSFTDTPGPVQHRRNGMAAALALVAVASLLTGLAVRHPVALGLSLTALSFVLTMLLVWGARAGAVGTAALLSAVLLLAHPPATPAAVLLHSALLVAGGAWYAALALLLSRMLPYRAAQQALGENLHALADFLRLKADFYNPATDLPADFRRLLAQQQRVSEAQEAGRDLLFRTRQIVSETTPEGRRLVLAFVEGVDLYEQVAATSFDYAQLRTAFAGTGALEAIGQYLRQLAGEVDTLGAAILANRRPANAAAARAAGLAAVQAAIAAAEAHPALAGRTRPLRKIFVNLRDIQQRIGRLHRYFDADPRPSPLARARRTAAAGAAQATVAALGPAEHVQFVSRQHVNWAALWQNLTLHSAVFRHAVRMALAGGFAFGLAQTLWQGRHSYWVLMTVTVMLKPGFSLTKERNQARIGGTLAGALLGGGLLALVPAPGVRLAALVLFMVLAYTFQRARYGVSVVFLTAYLLILFSFLGLSYLGVVQERVVDTLAGCAIAFAASYFLFPRWESDQLRPQLAAALHANHAYLAQLADRLAGRPVPALAYRLRRKDVYVAAANLQAAFQRMLSEPKSKQRRPAETHDFVVLNHVLSAHIAALSQSLPAAPGPPPALAPEARRALTSAQAALLRARQALAPETAAPAEPAEPGPPPAAPPDPALTEQLLYLQKVSTDLARVSEALAGA